MLGYLTKRIAAAVPTVIVVTVLVFAMIRAIPGDPASLMLGDIDNPALLAEMRHALGLDRPVGEQFLIWVGNALHGDLGMSIARREPVTHLVLTHFAVTAQVVLTATLLACLVAIPAGMIAAWRQNRRADTAIVSTSILFVSMPSFWVGILLIWLFGVKLNWLPVYGFESMAQGGLSAAKFLVLPVCAIVLTEIAAITRMMRASTIETLRLEYVAHARAKGLPEKRVMLRHVLPNSFGPTLTVIGLMLGHLLSGAAVIETVFTLPGIGRLLVESIYARDYPVVQGCLLFIALLYVAVNLVVDLLYPLFDPRVKLQ
ncbi:MULTISPECIES: ABC transporter permease [Achromobacter]|uniref:Glutathione transport system permease protein GsiC n=2 Tax=Achromobacter piechaudii TaxID=72556 RepID=A0A6S7EDS3_9BURK|nr:MULTISPECIES: ABC transporter permease [Achromobacter]EFF76601.1 ABC transporter, permease protein [Achromobacter piechaudii ATCC 43553]KNY12241.1 peptide ABC transporter [Achromobacter piechaudii]MPS78992.1 ABC transporter permease [Achromobacter sp.]CAB3717632.1 Glutathione transport system permease protein GsiC [Achromobacter piechaudii]CAB3885681.1 Glutathione transport system permease protein GsiC [Achromobacter piechaudii]